MSEKNLSSQLKQILIAEHYERVIEKQVPVIYFEANNNSKTNEDKIFAPEKIQSFTDNKIKEQLKGNFVANKNWKTLNQKNRDNINTFFQLEFINREKANQKISPRVAQTMMHLWANNTNIQSNI
jgi:TPP-dependent indolepyruvate ferredoxin oxidoreductase alpha subunit